MDLEFVNDGDHIRLYINDFHVFTLKDTASNSGLLLKAMLDLQLGKIPLYINDEPYYLTDSEDVKYVLDFLEKRDRFMKNTGLVIQNDNNQR